MLGPCGSVALGCTIDGVLQLCMSFGGESGTGARLLLYCLASQSKLNKQYLHIEVSIMHLVECARTPYYSINPMPTNI